LESEDLAVSTDVELALLAVCTVSIRPVNILFVANKAFGGNLMAPLLKDRLTLPG